MVELKQKSTRDEKSQPSAPVRLHKYLARCGLGSRRRCEEFIRDGRVAVNGQIVTRMGVLITPELDRVTFDGRIVEPPTRSYSYYLLHKPRGYLTTCKDERGRATIRDLVADIPERVFPVGRLDKESEGLLLLTDDGELAHRLMHPSFRIEKEYFVEVQGRLSAGALAQLVSGVVYEGEVYQPATVRVLSASQDRTRLAIVICEGKKRQIRRMCAAVGHRVMRLKRIREGALKLENLEPGKWRALTSREIEQLRREVGLD